MAGKIQPDISGDILTEFDYNNIILVDPNKTIKNGTISERLVDHENLVMYANLEAELLPRTKLAVGSSPDKIRTISIARINFLRPTKDEYLTTGYYDEITGENSTIGQGQNQIQTEKIPASPGDSAYTKRIALLDGKEGSIDNGLLGITSINIKISGSFIPVVTIELEDVQGRALFQLGENSPYAAFVHMPYPPFYLTIKGYYGQAIRYQLNLEKFETRFNSGGGGNYQITLTLKGYKFNILNEISMGHLLAAPHMYSTRFDISNSKNLPSSSESLQASATQQSSNIPIASNSQNTVIQQMYTEKGYQKIKEVFSEYKAKNLIDKNLPEITLAQLMNKLETFEQTIIDNFTKADVEPLTNIRKYIDLLKKLYGKVYGDSDSWFEKNLNPKPFILSETGQRIYAYKNEILLDKQIEAESNLSKILIEYNKELDSNPTLGVDGTTPIKNGISITNMTATTTFNKVDWVKTYTEQTGILNPSSESVQTFINSNEISRLFTPALVKGVNPDNQESIIGPKEPGNTFITKGNPKNSVEQIFKSYFFIFDGKERFIEITQQMSAEATKKLSDLEKKISEELKKKIEDSQTGLGFSPTVRNIVAIIFASAEGFIRLLDETHTKAWNVKYDPVRKNAILDNNTSSAQGSDQKQVVQSTTVNPSNTTLLQTPVYPWPQFFVEDTVNDKKGKYQLKYIGDPSVVSLTKGYLYDKWPEVEFIEEYIKGLTQRYTPPSDISATDIQQFTDMLNINAIEFPLSDVVYANKEETKFFFEIWERQFMTSRYENLGRFLKGVGEYENLKNLIVKVDTKNLITALGVSNPFLNSKFKNYAFTAQNYLTVLKQVTNDGTSKSYKDYLCDIFVTPYIETLTKKSFSILSLDNIGQDPSNSVDSTGLETIVKSTQTNKTNITDLYPFTNSTWSDENLIDRNSSQGDLMYNTTKGLTVYTKRNIISNFTELFSYDKIRPVTNFSYKTVENPLTLSQVYSSTNQTGFLPNFYYNRIPKNFVPTEGYCNFDVPTNVSLVLSPNISSTLPLKTTTSIINTPFFINSIISGVDKLKNNVDYPFVSAAYLFINSLPLMSLREKYKTVGTNLNELDYMFATLKKFGAIHKLPYAWMLKMGSIWHRYKKSVENNVDILSDIWKVNDYKNSYDPITNNPSKVYTLTIDSKITTIQLENIDSYGAKVQVGFYPKLINYFNYFYTGVELYSTYTDAEIQSSINSGVKVFNFVNSNLNLTQNSLPLNLTTWSVLVPSEVSGYFAVPSFGGNQNQIVNSLTFNNQVIPGFSVTGNTSVYNGSMRTLWSAPNYGYFDASQIKKPDTKSYLNVIEGNGDTLSPYMLSNKDNYTKIEEIFSIFEKDILDTFEIEFLNFSKGMNDMSLIPNPNLTFGQTTGNQNTTYRNFQSLFKSAMLVSSPVGSVTNETYFTTTIGTQFGNFNSTILKFLEYDVIFKYGNPSNYNRYFWDSYLVYKSSFTTSLQTPFSFEPYNKGGALPPNTTVIASKAAYPNEWKSLETYVGFSTIPKLEYKDSGSYITDFFIDNDIAFNQENIKNLSTIIKMYATQKLNNNSLTKIQFQTLINDYLTNCNDLQSDILNGVLTNLNKDLPNYQEVPEKTIDSKVDGQQSKVDLYEAFKALNDKWIAGGDFTNKTYFEDILFLDKASRDIGNVVYIDIFALKEILNKKDFNMKMSVYTFIASLMLENNFNVMNLPAYVNFYNVKVVDGLDVAKPDGYTDFGNNMWGTFLNVDYRESGPKMVCFFVGRPSSYVALPESKNYLFANDGIQLERQGPGNPLIEDQTNKKDWAKSNKCVGFTVDIGIRNQNIFQSFNVNQSNGKGTAESTQTLLNMIEQSGGRQVATQNVSLFNYYSQRSYGATVVSLGNAMIQPTMYFNLRHVPMFNGAYFITEVDHVITPGQFQTSFTGTRQGVFDLPSIDNYLQTINQNLLTKLEKEVINRDDNTVVISVSTNINTANVPQNAENTIAAQNSCVSVVNPVYTTGSYRFESTGATETVLTRDELVTKIKAATSDVNLQAAIYSICYLRTYKSGGFRGFNNNLAMISLKPNYSPTFTYNPYFNNYYSCINSKTTSGVESLPIVHFKDVDTMIGFMVARLKQNISNIATTIGLHQFYICTWLDQNISVETFNNNRDTVFKESKADLRVALQSANVDGIKISNVDIFINGKNYTPPTTTTTTTTSSTTATATTSTTASTTTTTTTVTPTIISNVLDIQTIKDINNNPIKIIVTFKQNAGLWKFDRSNGNILSNSPCGAYSISNPGTTDQQLTFTPYQNCVDSCTSALKTGTYNLKYEVNAIPILSNGQPDTTREKIINYPISTTVVESPSIQIYKVERITTGGNDIKVTVSILPNVGLWKIFATEGDISSSTPCGESGTMSSPGQISADFQQAVFKPYQEAVDSCDGDNGVHGVVPMTFRTVANPILPNGQSDPSRVQQWNTFKSNITI